MWFANDFIKHTHLRFKACVCCFCRGAVIVIVSLPSNLLAQKENNIWMMSNQLPNQNCGIDFNSGIADTFSLLRNMNFFLLDASICDTSGMLLFYTNGQYIANRNHDTLLNSVNFNPGWLTDYYSPYGMGLPQGAFVIPRPDHYGQYYVFHESGEIVSVSGSFVSQPVNLSYSLVDMSLDGGLGGIVSGKKSIHAINDTLIYGRITGVKHANGRDWWIVVHRSDSELFYKILVTPDTILGAFPQNIGRAHHFERFEQQALFNPQGDKYVIELTADTTITFGNIIDLYDFDRCSGSLFNQRDVIVPDSELLALGCSFSPNGRFLYVSTNVNIYQYDTWDSSMNTNVIIVAQWDTFYSPLKSTFLFHQLAPDARIYISTYEGTNVLHYINDPDQQGIACNVVQNSFFLPSLNNFCMPNAPNYTLGSIIGSLCDTVFNSVPELSENKRAIFAFPNPASDQITLMFNSSETEQQLHILDITGRIVMSPRVNANTFSAKIDLTKLSPGSYIFLLNAKNSINQKCKFDVVR